MWQSSAQTSIICLFELVHVNDLHYFSKLVHLNDLLFNEKVHDVVEEVNVKEDLKSSIFDVQKAAAPKNIVEFRQSSTGTVRSSLATSYDVWRRRGRHHSCDQKIDHENTHAPTNAHCHSLSSCGPKNWSFNLNLFVPYLVYFILGWLRGWCNKRGGEDQNFGVIHLGFKCSRDQCLVDCLKIKRATGCEFHADQCDVHTRQVCGANGGLSHSCLVLPKRNCRGVLPGKYAPLEKKIGLILYIIKIISFLEEVK